MRKQRTRQHFIEDFGMNYIERQVLHAHCTLERYRYDYGYDAFRLIKNVQNGTNRHL